MWCWTTTTPTSATTSTACSPRTRGSPCNFTPTSGSWLNLVEVLFGIITRQAIRPGSFDSVKQLVGAIRTFIEGWNERCHPFVWTKTADDILPHATRQLQTRVTLDGTGQNAAERDTAARDDGGPRFAQSSYPGPKVPQAESVHAL